MLLKKISTASLWKAIYSKTCHLSGNSNLLVISFIISSYILFLRSLPVPVNSNSVGRGKLWKFSGFTVEPLHNGHLGKENGRCRGVLKLELMYGLSAKKGGRCREVTISGEALVER